MEASIFFQSIKPFTFRSIQSGAVVEESQTTAITPTQCSDSGLDISALDKQLLEALKVIEEMIEYFEKTPKEVPKKIPAGASGSDIRFKRRYIYDKGLYGAKQTIQGLANYTDDPALVAALKVVDEMMDYLTDTSKEVPKKIPSDATGSAIRFKRRKIYDKGLFGAKNIIRPKLSGDIQDKLKEFEDSGLTSIAAIDKLLSGGGGIACLAPYLNDPMLQLSLSMGSSGKGNFDKLEPKGDFEKPWFNYGLKGGMTHDWGIFKLRWMGYISGEVYKESGGETPNTGALGLGLKAFLGNESIAGEVYGYWDSIHNKYQNFGNFSRLNARNNILTTGGAFVTDFTSSGLFTLRGFAEYSRNSFTNYGGNYLDEFEVAGFDQTARFGGLLRLNIEGFVAELGVDYSIGDHETASFDGNPPNYIYDTEGWSLQFSLGMPNLSSFPWKIFHTYREQGLEAHQKTFQQIGGVGLYYSTNHPDLWYAPNIEVIFGSYNTNPYYPSTTDPFVTTRLSLRVMEGDGAWLPNWDVSISTGADKQIDRAAGIGRDTWNGYFFGGLSLTWDAAPKKKD